MTRRPLAAFAALATALTLAACGTDDTAAGPATASGASSDAFPVTIEHTFGATTIPAEPTRVVTVGFNEQDFTLALGVTPVGVREYFGYDYAQRPWAADLLPAEPLPEVGGAEAIDLEAVAALQPDLILGVYSFMDEATYELLSGIAPTIAGSVDAEAGGTPWQEQTLLTGRALGLADRAQELVEEVEGQFAAATEANPDWAGQALALDYYLEGHYLFGADDLRARFFTDLGFTVPAESTPLSPESLDQLDQDVLVVGGADQVSLADDALFNALSVVTEDRTVYLGAFDTDLLGALGFGSPLSLSYALDEIVPALQDAADGDPATVVEQPAA